MKPRFRFATVALLAAAATPAFALQLGKIEVKSALNQPLVASIPLHPESLTELDGITVGLASPGDFARVGLQLTATDKTLRFQVVTDTNGQKLILVTSSQPITDPYLDFLVRVDTRAGKQLREYVVLLNPVIEAPPVVQSAPVVTGAPHPAAQPAPTPAPQQALEPEPVPQVEAEAAAPQPGSQAQPESTPQAPPQPSPQPQPQPPPPPQVIAARPTQPAAAPTQVDVNRGDTLSGIASAITRGSGVTLNQMMMALKTANPEAFFGDNINNLKAGAILRIPTREEIDRRSIAEATAEVRRQYEAWQASKPHPAIVVEGTAAEAAARSAPAPGNARPASDHLTLVPPSGWEGGGGDHAGVAGGSGNATVAGLQQQVKRAGDTLVSLKQSNADLQSRLRSLDDIAGKSDKLLSMKDATIAELQRKLAEMQAGGAGTSARGDAATAASVVLSTAATPAGHAQQVQPASKTSAPPPPTGASAWYTRPVAWIIAGLVVVGLILLLLSRRRHPADATAGARGPLADPDDVATGIGAPGYAASLAERIKDDPGDVAAHLALCRLYYAQQEPARFFAAAEAMRPHVDDPDGEAWREVVSMGAELAPRVADGHVAAPEEQASGVGIGLDDDPYGMHGLREMRRPDATPQSEASRESPSTDASVAYAPETPTAATASAPPSEAALPLDDDKMLATASPDAEPAYSDDPVDTKLDLARAYLDMGDPVGARAMLEEVLEEGSQTQKDQATQLLADVAD